MDSGVRRSFSSRSSFCSSSMIRCSSFAFSISSSFSLFCLSSALIIVLYASADCLFDGRSEEGWNCVKEKKTRHKEEHKEKAVNQRSNMD